jgi:hypothetical protein
MPAFSRRQFLLHSASIVALAASGVANGALAAMEPNDKFDLVVKGRAVLGTEPESESQQQERRTNPLLEAYSRGLGRAETRPPECAVEHDSRTPPVPVASRERSFSTEVGKRGLKPTKPREILSSSRSPMLQCTTEQPARPSSFDVQRE